jgi:hypothetical protein
MNYFKNQLENMRYTPLNSNWCFSAVNIPDLELIKQELIALEQIVKIKQSNNKIYSNIYKNIVYKHCPLLKKYLESVNLSQKFNRILFSKEVILNNNRTVHVDSYDPTTTSHSLNIPLRDYEDSYTAWYKTDKEQLIDSLQFGLDPINNFAFLLLNDAEEIQRYSYATGKAVLVNTTILHKGISDKKTRMICGIRFFPELTVSDIKNLGITDPYQQE